MCFNTETQRHRVGSATSESLSLCVKKSSVDSENTGDCPRRFPEVDLEEEMKYAVRSR